VRRYLEDRFALRAPELTTEEFLARAGDSTALAPGHRAVLRSFLERCDRVKFAAYRPPESESREVIAAARRFLEETRPSLEPAAPRAHPPRRGEGRVPRLRARRRRARRSRRRRHRPGRVRALRRLPLAAHARPRQPGAGGRRPPDREEPRGGWDRARRRPGPC